MIHIFHMFHWCLFQSTAPPGRFLVSPWLDPMWRNWIHCKSSSSKWKGLLPGVHRWYWKIHWNEIFDEKAGDNLPGRSERNAKCWADASWFWMIRSSLMRPGHLASSYCFINWKINSMIPQESLRPMGGFWTPGNTSREHHNITP